MSPQDFEKRLAWVSTLKVGDEVAMDISRYGYVSWRIAKVTKVTPSGRLNLDNSLVVNADGSIRGDYHSHIQEVTTEIRIEIWRKNAIGRINKKMNLEKLTSANLKVILDMIRDSE